MVEFRLVQGETWVSFHEKNALVFDLLDSLDKLPVLVVNVVEFVIFFIKNVAAQV